MQRHSGRDLLGMRDVQRLPAHVCRGPVRRHAGHRVRSLQLRKSAWDLPVGRVHNQHQHAVHELHDGVVPFWAVARSMWLLYGQLLL